LWFRGKAPKEVNGETQRAELKFGAGFWEAEALKGEARRTEQNAGSKSGEPSLNLLRQCQKKTIL